MLTETSTMTAQRRAAIVLTGGESRRMGRHKAALQVGGRAIVARLVDAAREAQCTTVVVGRADGVPAGTTVVRESPPGGGPVPGIAAGLAALEAVPGAPPAQVAVLAGDLPFVTGAALDLLFAALDGADLAVAAGSQGAANWLCAAWRADVLHARLGAVADGTGSTGGVSVRRLVAGVRHVLLPDDAVAGPGWADDVDTPADLTAARARATSGAGEPSTEGQSQPVASPGPASSAEAVCRSGDSPPEGR